MNKDFLSLVKDSFENMDKMNFEDIQALILETNQYFSSLASAMSSGDEDVKANALNEALEVKRFLEQKSAEISQVPGYEPVTEQERAIWQQIQESFQFGKEKNKTTYNKLKPIKMS